ncbi:MAG: iron-sulfur cluster assembly scaffold protein [Novosphingobium sp.]|nr:iron-sulfur cluster assembly scaffold protein [Novosphingobium sp.]
MSATVLYTPQVLALATELADYPWDETLALRSEARSRSCGSTIALALGLDTVGRVERVAIRSHACAIGQAAAAIFARAACGRPLAALAADAGHIEAWLAGKSGLPDWPGIEAIAAARDYPARHGAIMLAWNAARQLLPSQELQR